MTSFLSGGRGSVFDVLACQSLDLGSTPDGSLSFSFSSACVISTSYKFFSYTVYYTCSCCYRDSEKAIERIYTDAEIKLVIRKVSSETRYNVLIIGRPRVESYSSVFTGILFYSCYVTCHCLRARTMHVSIPPSCLHICMYMLACLLYCYST